MANSTVQAMSSGTPVAPLAGDSLFHVSDPFGSPADAQCSVEQAIHLAHGEISVTGGASGQAITLSTWTKITQFTAEQTGVNVTSSHANDKLTVANAHWHQCLLSCSFQDNTGGTDVHFGIYYNGALSKKGRLTTGAAADDHNMFVQTLVDTSSTQDFEVYVFTSASVTITLTEASLVVLGVGL